MSTLAQQLADFGLATMRDGAPEAVRSSVADRILDIVGLQAAALPLDTSEAAIRFAEDQGGKPQAHIVGRPTRLPAAWAAFVNGVLAHSLDYDDTHLPSVLHPSASVVPAGLAAAELYGVRGPAVLDAIGVGIEVVVRLGMAGFDRTSNDSVYFQHGQHATSICGVIGSAVAVALLAGLDRDRIVDVIGIACSMASGIIEGNRVGGTVKRLHCGWAAHGAVTATQLVEHGFTGPASSLEGRFGLFEAFLHGAADLESVTVGLGDEWAVPGIFFKPYPANHFAHTALDAARNLRERHDLAVDDIHSVVLGVAASTVRTIGEPIEVKRRPGTGYQAQFSGPYLVALGFLGGGGLGASLDDFTDELAQDPQRVALMARIDVRADDRCTAIYPYQFPAILTVITVDGRQLVEEVLVNRGGPENPLTAEELRTKFRTNAARSFGAADLDTVEDAVRALAGSAGDVADVLVPFAQLPVGAAVSLAGA